MEFQIPLNKFEKEKKVIYLHKEGKTLKEIAIIVHMSFRDISRIIKVYDKKISLQQNKKEENNPLNQKIKKLSKNIKAYDLFRIGKTPVEVAIELNLDFQRVRKHWLEYLRLNKMTKLYNIYIENEYNLDYIFKIYYFLLRNEISLEDCEKVLSIAYDTIKLYKTRSTLTEEIEGLKQMKNNYLLNQNSMKNHQLPSLGPLPRYYNW